MRSHPKSVFGQFFDCVSSFRHNERLLPATTKFFYYRCSLDLEALVLFRTESFGIGDLRHVRQHFDLLPRNATQIRARHNRLEFWIFIQFHLALRLLYDARVRGLEL